MIRHSVRALIEGSTDWTVCGEAENGAIAIERVKDLRPDIVVLDLAMPVMNGIDAARQIARIDPKVLMVMFTMFTGDQLGTIARDAGIRGTVSKADGAADLIPSIQALLAEAAA